MEGRRKNLTRFQLAKNILIDRGDKKNVKGIWLRFSIVN